MLKQIVFILAATMTVVACSPKHQHAKSEEEVEAQAYKNAPKSDGKHFGAMIDAKNAMAYDALLVKVGALKKGESINAKVEGKVESVCQMKGCWMNIVSETPNKPSMFVKFKDYAFFMPKDLSGKKVIMDGKAFFQETSVEELRHYAEDEGKSKEDIAKITQPKRELKFLAAGVVLVD
jgi:Domain of unknown function (DUF4920)